MTSLAIILVLWSALCLGVSLMRTDKAPVLHSLGTGLVLWSLGIGTGVSLWLVTGFIAKAFG